MESKEELGDLTLRARAQTHQTNSNHFFTTKNKREKYTPTINN